MLYHQAMMGAAGVSNGASVSRFVNSLGTPSYDDMYNSVDCDNTGNIIAVGSWTRAANPYDTSALLVSYDNFGVPAWQRSIGGSANDVFRGVTVDSSNNIIAVGDEASISLCGYNCAFITLWSTDGVNQWQKCLNSSYFSSFNDVTIGIDNYIYAVGLEAASASGGYHKGMIAKYDPSNGSCVQKISIGGVEGNTMFYGIDIDDDGNIYAVGSDTKNGFGQQAFAVKFNASLVPQWQLTIGGTLNDQLGSVKILPDGNILAVGYSYSGSCNCLIAKLTPAGQSTYKYISSSSAQLLHGVSVHENDVIIVGTDYTYDGSAAGYISKYDYVAETIEFQKWFNGGHAEQLFGCVAVEGGLYAVGYESTTSIGLSNALLLSMDSDPSYSGTLPDLPALSWHDSTLSVSTAGVSVFNPSYTTSTPPLTPTTTTFSVASLGLANTTAYY